MSESSEGESVGPTRILLVDDAEDSLTGLARFFRKQGFEVETATDGLKAVELLNAGFAPAVVFTDLMLPELDGLGVAMSARSCGVPVVVLATGDASFQLDERNGEGLVDLVLIKPLSLQRVLTQLREVLAERG